MTTIKLFGGDLGSEMLLVRCNLSEASAPVQVNYCNDDDSDWGPTQYQCAHTCHRASGLIGLGKQLAAAAVLMPEDEFDCEAEEIEV